MPSQAYNNLIGKQSELDLLWWFHLESGGDLQGRRYGLEVLNKAVVVFVCAAWEAYCEDMILEAKDLILTGCHNPNLLSNHAKTPIANALRESKAHLDVWDLAGDGWKALWGKQVDTKVAKLNSPKSADLVKLYKQTLGIVDITQNWYWQNCNNQKAKSRLDKLVTLRGEIAHKLITADSVKKTHGNTFYSHIKLLAEKIELTLAEKILEMTGNDAW